MNLVELDQALRKLRLSGMADLLDTRLRQAQTEQMAPIDLVATLVSDELQRRQERLLARRHKQARFRDPDRSLDGFDFAFNMESPGDHRPRSFAARFGQDSGRSAPWVQPKTTGRHQPENVHSARGVSPKRGQFSVAIDNACDHRKTRPSSCHQRTRVPATRPEKPESRRTPYVRP